MTPKKNGSDIAGAGLEFFMHSNPPRFVPVVNSFILDLSVSDYVEIFCRIEATDSSGGRVLANSVFSGFKLIGV